MSSELKRTARPDPAISKRVILATQHYPPDSSTTATYLGKIAGAFAVDSDVVVLSATSGSASATRTPANPVVIEIGSTELDKRSIVRRALAVVGLATTMFLAVLKRARRDDVVFCVTTPFTLPYAVVLAAKMRGATTVLLVYDLYPEALVAAGFVGARSALTKVLRFLNGVMFRALDGIVVVGRDVPPLLATYSGVAAEKIAFIPNWTFLPIGYRELSPSNRFRPRDGSHLVVGLSGNLGFTHDPTTIFEAARILRDETGIHFLLSGWGVGWQQLRDRQAAEQLPNVTLLDPVPAEQLTEFLAAADVWTIPYRRNMVGVSIPSRLYNLLAVGRAVIVNTEDHSEAGIEIRDENIGWVVPPEDPARLAGAIRAAAADRANVVQMGQRAAIAAQKFTEQAALARYRSMIAAIRKAR